MIKVLRRDAGLGAGDELAPGQVIAGYRVERLIGTGGMGAVYEATQLSLKRRVALKLIAAGVPVNDTLRGRFRREGELQAGIDHPHVLPVYEAGEDRGRLFIAMRLVDGPTLKTLASRRALDAGTAVRILSDVAGALDAAHAVGLIHRDVKPQNILLGPGQHAYLADFGLSRGSADATLTRDGQLLGSVSYMAPEVVRGGASVGPAADIYSFTCVVYECLVGLTPFPRDSDPAVLHAHVYDPVPAPSEIRAELPRALDAAIAHGMAKQPEERPFTATAVMDEVREALGLAAPVRSESGLDTLPLLDADDESSPTLERPAAPVVQTRARRSGPVIAAIALVGLLAGAAVGFATGGSQHTTTTTTTTSRPARIVQSGGDRDYARSLNAAVQRLDRTRAALDRDLRKARTAKRQAAILASLGTRYAQAQVAVAAAKPPDDAAAANAALARALAQVKTDYRRLSAAARAGHGKTYSATRAALKRDQAAVASAFRTYGNLGYRVR